MATTATAEFYDKQAKLARENADIAYNTALADLARKFGVANRQLESNMEARGILRSGEANTYRTELTAEEQAAKTAAEMAKLGAYNQADLTLAQQLAALGSSGGGSSSGVGQPSTPATPATPRPVVAYQTPTVAFAGPYGAMVKPASKPVTQARTGTADTMSRRLTPTRPVRVPGRGFRDY